MVLLENELFLSELTKMCQRSKLSGSVIITMKRYDGREKPLPHAEKKARMQEPEHGDPKCLLRASLGNRKISTVVSQKDVNKFQMAYANVLKANLDGLKKRDRRAVSSTAKSSQQSASHKSKSAKQRTN